MNDKITIIVSTHIEYDLVNKLPTIVYTDSNGVEWITKDDSIFLEEKLKSWYFKTPTNKK